MAIIWNEKAAATKVDTSVDLDNLNPKDADLAVVKDEDAIYVYDGDTSAWVIPATSGGGGGATTSYVNAQDALVSGTVTSGYEAADIALSGAVEAAYVSISGETMTGFLTLHADPTASGQIATKQYVDANAGSGSSYVSLSGNETVSGVKTFADGIEFPYSADGQMSFTNGELITPRVKGLDRGYSRFKLASPVTTVTAAYALAHNSLDGNIYAAAVTNARTISPFTGAELAYAAVASSNMRDVAFCPISGSVWLPSDTGAKIMVYSYADAVTVTITGAGNQPRNLTWSPSDEFMYVSNYGDSNGYAYIDPTNCTVSGFIAASGSSPVTIVPCPVNGKLYAGCTNTIDVINTTTKTVEANFAAAGSSCFGGAYCPSNNRIYMSNSQKVNIINPEDNSLVTQLTVGTYPYGVCYNPVCDKVFVANYTSKTVSVIEPSSNTVIRTITLPYKPFGLVYSPTVDLVFVSYFEDNRIQAIASY